MRRVIEVSTTGIDDALQGLTSDPFSPAQNPGTTGLRIPAFVNTPTTRYLFLLARLVVSGRGRIRGIRQGLNLGALLESGDGTPQVPVEFPADPTTAMYSDGNVSWHLVKEPFRKRVTSPPLTNTVNWSFVESDTPALLYQTFSNSVVDPLTGAPAYYFLNMTGYTPPSLSQDWQPLGGLGNFHDIRFPWLSPWAWNSLDIPFEEEGESCISLYASVLQTNSSTRNNPEWPNPATPDAEQPGYPPGRAFDYNVSAISNYYRVMGSIICETEVC